MILVLLFSPVPLGLLCVAIRGFATGDLAEAFGALIMFLLFGPLFWFACWGVWREENAPDGARATPDLPLPLSDEQMRALQQALARRMGRYALGDFRRSNYSQEDA